MGKVNKTDREWQRELSPDEFRITRQKGTEPAFTGQYWNTKSEGTYVCRCCETPLFSSDSKYDSGSGWPSFYRAVSKGNIEETEDTSHGMNRTEILCKVCDAHLGHLFDDGPQPTGLRYCVNSASLKLVSKENLDEDSYP